MARRNSRSPHDCGESSGVAGRYLALGDSYTIGHGVAAEESFPVQLLRRLGDHGIPMEEPRIIAVTGWSTGQLIEGIAAEKLQTEFDLVTLLIGVNNQYRELDTAEYRAEYRQLLQQAIRFAGGQGDHVLVLSIPDYGVTPFAATRDRARITREIDALNAIKLEETQKTKAQYFEITGISRQAEFDPILLAQDGLHPSAEMYRKWVGIIYPAAEKLLRKKFHTR